MSVNYINWDMSDGRFWDPVSCNELFLMFDTSAHSNNGVPDVPAGEVLAHVRECEECFLACVEVSGIATTPVLHYDW